MEKEFTKAMEIEIRREEYEFNDLLNDFEFVKELNKGLSEKYQDFILSFPNVEEIDYLIEHLQSKKVILNSELENKKRLFQLKRFRSALVMLQKDKVDAKPIRYDELINGQKP